MATVSLSGLGHGERPNGRLRRSGRAQSIAGVAQREDRFNLVARTGVGVVSPVVGGLFVEVGGIVSQATEIDRVAGPGVTGNLVSAPSPAFADETVDRCSALWETALARSATRRQLLQTRRIAPPAFHPLP